MKSIFITGAASGIGRAVAEKFAGANWFTILTDIDEAGLHALAGRIGRSRCLTHVFDVRQKEGWAEAMAATAAVTDGRLDVLFNNAGIARAGPFDRISQVDNDAIIDINVKGVVNGAYAALPLLEKTQGARIINVSSVAGLIGAPHLAVYSATKWAVRGFTEALDNELSARGVRVVSLMPFFMETPILDKAAPDGTNESMMDRLRESGVEVYPVAMAAEAAWQAAFGKAMHYPVGKRAEQAERGMRLFPKATRKQLRRSILPK